ncbi:MAG: glutamine--fructose-6-phosphate aminotransferase, partial [Candidatus Niyogibacteria bacterium]|nr:glutamine--fructose-6-phosphate aminotransferase [Candidatus Niyogibacteria bacterium]
MCGIVGYIGKKNAVGTVLKNLKLLEYRGYDSAGVAAIDEFGGVYLKKAAGRISSLEKKMRKYPKSNLAIAHTRWATHGEPSVLIAHPHFDCKEKIYVAHNGIIENYETLKSALLAEGHEISSATDTEVLAHLIEREFSLGASNLEDAVKYALKHVTGTFGLAVLSKDEPGVLVGARRGSPLIIGVGRGEYILASDPSAIVGETKKVIYLNDDEMVVLTPKKRKILNLLNGAGSKNGLRKTVHTLEWTIEDSQKGGFPHFMAKEIFEAPQVIANAFRGRILAEKGEVRLGGLDSAKKRLSEAGRVIIAACGTSYFAGLVGKYFFEELGHLPA